MRGGNVSIVGGCGGNESGFGHGKVHGYSGENRAIPCLCEMVCMCTLFCCRYRRPVLIIPRLAS